MTGRDRSGKAIQIQCPYCGRTYWTRQKKALFRVCRAGCQRRFAGDGSPLPDELAGVPAPAGRAPQTAPAAPGVTIRGQQPPARGQPAQPEQPEREREGGRDREPAPAGGRSLVEILLAGGRRRDG